MEHINHHSDFDTLDLNKKDILLAMHLRKIAKFPTSVFGTKPQLFWI